MTDALPNVSGIRVADVLAQLGSIVGRLAWALAAIGGVALLSGALVLASTLAAAQRQRVAEAAVLRVLGATGPQLRAAWLVEFAVLGSVAGVCAGVVGGGLSWLLMREVLRARWGFLPWTLSAVGAAEMWHRVADIRQVLHGQVGLHRSDPLAANGGLVFGPVLRRIDACFWPARRPLATVSFSGPKGDASQFAAKSERGRGSGVAGRPAAAAS